MVKTTQNEKCIYNQYENLVAHQGICLTHGQIENPATT